MKGHDWVIFIMTILLCFNIGQVYRINEMATLSNKKIILNNYLDTALESAVYNNFEEHQGHITWKKDEVIESFMSEVNKMLTFNYENFPVIMLREGDVLYIYANRSWSQQTLGDNYVETIKNTVEEHIANSTVSVNNGLKPNVYFPKGFETTYVNPIEEYSIFAVMQIESSYLSRNNNIYIVSGASIGELIS